MESSMIDPKIFESLKGKVEEDVKMKQALSELCDQLAKDVSYTQGVLSRIHSTPCDKYPTLLLQVEDAIRPELEAVRELARFASNQPYYKYNQLWSRMVQDAIFTVVLCAWLGGMATASRSGELGRLLTLEEVGEIFQVPVNLRDRDAFHITLEEYLLSLPSLAEELARLAVNAVTHDDHALAVRICTFVKDLQGGFQLLNLKNDALRRRVDGLKYSVKRVEDVVYDLSLRNLIPATEK